MKIPLSLTIFLVCIVALGCQNNSIVDPVLLPEQSGVALYKAAPPIERLISLEGIVAPKQWDDKFLYHRIKGDITYQIASTDNSVVEVLFVINAELWPMYVPGPFQQVNEKSQQKVMLDKKGFGTIDKYYRLPNTKADMYLCLSMTVSQRDIQVAKIWIAGNPGE